MRCAGQVLRGSGVLEHIQMLKSPLEEKRKVGAPRRIWMKDILEWIDSNDKNDTGKGDTYRMAKRIEETKIDGR